MPDLLLPDDWLPDDWLPDDWAGGVELLAAEESEPEDDDVEEVAGELSLAAGFAASDELLVERLSLR